MQELEKILEEIGELRGQAGSECTSEDHYIKKAWEHCLDRVADIIRRHMNDGWIPVEERLPEEKRANYEVTFINECGYEEHGFAQWYDGEFHVPAVVIAWRNHLEPYIPERSEGE